MLVRPQHPAEFDPLASEIFVPKLLPRLPGITQHGMGWLPCCCECSTCQVCSTGQIPDEIWASVTINGTHHPTCSASGCCSQLSGEYHFVFSHLEQATSTGIGPGQPTRNSGCVAVYTGSCPSAPNCCCCSVELRLQCIIGGYTEGEEDWVEFESWLVNVLWEFPNSATGSCVDDPEESTIHLDIGHEDFESAPDCSLWDDTALAVIASKWRCGPTCGSGSCLVNPGTSSILLSV